MKEQKILQGQGSLDRLSDLMNEGDFKRILLITGRRSFSENPGKKRLLASLAGREYKIFNDFRINPKYEDVLKGVEVFQEYRPDLLIAVGGGTVIDMAKLVNALVGVAQDAPRYIRGEKKLEQVSQPMAIIPTTSGSGSEATHFAVVYLEGKKFSLAHSDMLPDYVVLDPQLTESMSAYVTACSGMDALCQGIESYWSVNSTEESLKYSRQAVELAIQNIRQAVKNPNGDNREAMQMAAYNSGRGINITKTTAAHAFSYHLTSQYDIPHGQAVGLLMGWVFDNNLGVNEENCLDLRGVEFVKARLDELRGMLGVGKAESAVLYFDSLIEELGLRADNFMLTKKNKKELFEAVNVERLKNNPVSVQL